MSSAQVWRKALRDTSARLAVVETALAEAINELHCCDDVPLQAGLTEGIEALQRSRNKLIESLFKAESNRDDWRDRAETAEAELAALRTAVEVAREALEIIAGKRQCRDNLMGNRDVAEQALTFLTATQDAKAG